MRPKKEIDYWKLPYPMVELPQATVELLKEILNCPKAFAALESDPFLCNQLEKKAWRPRANYPLYLTSPISRSVDGITLDNYFRFKLNDTRFYDNSLTARAYLRWIWIIKLINFNRARRKNEKTITTPKLLPIS